MSQTTSAAVLSSAATSALSQLPPGALPPTYVEADPAQRGQAKLGHLLGIFGIVGTGIFYLVKRKDAGAFAKDQMREAFNFHVVVFAVAVVLGIAGSVAATLLGKVAIVFSLTSMTLMLGAIVLSVLNALKAAKGNVARYPVRINVLK
jgi:uncharacterized Tic20 family protein